MRRLMRVLTNEQGIETLEWTLIGGLITAVALLVYPGVLGPGLTTAIGTIVAAITGSMPAA